MKKITDLVELKKLSEEDLGQILYVLLSPAYINVFQPYLVLARNTLNNQLLDPSEQRKDNRSDDFLRGAILTVDGLLAYFDSILTTIEMAQMEKTNPPLTSEEEYQKMREQGLVRPSGQTEQPEEGYAPEEDY